MKKTTLLILALLGLAVSASVGAAPGPSVTIAASRPIVVYGQSVTLSGTVSSHKSGETVTLASEALGKTSFSNFATATTTTHGAWSAVAKPTIQTMYRATWMTTTSQDVTVKVRPLVQLKLISAAHGSFSVSVTGDRPFTGQYVLVQRLTSTGVMVVKHVTLDTSSSATFTVRLHHGLSRLRAVFPTSQAAPGYVTGTSNVVTVRR
jgi:hypothetical protein